MLDLKKSADDMMQFIKKVESEVGPRLPASDEERKAAVLIKDEYEKTIGLTPVSEPFKVAPRSGIGAIPWLGWIAVLAFIVYIASPLAGAIISGLTLFYTITMVFIYTNMFDFLWPKKDSENFYTVQEPRSGKTDFTILLGAHYDSSWHWILQYKNPKTFIPKLVYGLVGMIGIIVGGIILSVSLDGFPSIITAIVDGKITAWYQWLAVCFPVACLPGIFSLHNFLSHDKSLASPGAMDNLTGIGLNMQIAKYFNEHPEELPEGCKLINTGFGCEESGLKGSFAFVKKHKGDGLFNNCYAINVDSVSDYDYFEVVKGDPMQFAFYDEDMVNLAYSCLEDVGCIRKTGKIVNPIGGNDATPLHRAGVKAVTIAAQNPVPTNYYHTCNDKSDRLDTKTFEEGIDVVYRLIKKICALEEAKKQS